MSGLLLVGACSGGGGGGGGSGGGSGSGSGAGKATGTPERTATGTATDAPGTATGTPTAPPTALDFTPDPARAPKTRADAVRLAGKVAAGPELWGAGYVRSAPDSDPDTWPVLDDDCVWQREPVPDDVLASVTRYSELPAADGKGPVRVAVTVTVHQDADGADWEQASTLEEALRCPDQLLRAGERISGLKSLGTAFGRNGNEYAEDSLFEYGEYRSDALGGPYAYVWTQGRIGQITVAATGRGSEGHDYTELSRAMAETQSSMLLRLENELEVDG